MAIVIYTKNDCRPCKETKKRFKEFGIDFEEINLDENPQFLEHVTKDLGFMAAPVVVTDTDAWSGFQPGKIKAIKR